MSQNQIKLTILSPVHNEEKILKSFVEHAANFLNKESITGEIVLVENGSTDKTWEEAEKLKKKYKNLVVLKTSDGLGNKGKALKLGLEEARGDDIVTIDTDLWDDDFVKKSIENLVNYDVVVGSKSLSGSKDKRPLGSRLMNVGYNFLMKFLFDFQGTESHAKLSFKKSKILPLVKECKTEDLVFDTELILRAERAGLKKLEIPTSVKEIRPRRFSVFNQLSKTIGNTLVLLKSIGPKFNKSYLIILLALLIAVLMRVTNLYDWFFFSVDEEHYSYMTRMITVDHHLPLIGGPISGTSLYMAPWFLYFNAIFFLFSGNNPVFSGLVFSLLGSLVVIFVYLVGKKLFSTQAGVIAALLFGGSFLMSLFDRHFWNITLTPLISILTFYFLLKWLEGGKKWVIILGLLTGFGLSTTFSVFAIFIFALLVLTFFKKPIFKIDILIFLGIVILAHLTLPLFDITHNFFLSKGVLALFQSGNMTSSVPLMERVVTTLSLFGTTMSKALVISSPVNVSEEISICYQNVTHYQPQLLAVIAALICCVVYLWTALKMKKKEVWLIGLLFLVNFASLFIFRTDAAERHWLPFLPLFFVIAGLTLSIIYRRSKLVAVILIIMLVSLNLLSFRNSYATHGISKKMAIVDDVIENTDEGKFFLYTTGDCHMWGYRYLFSLKGHEPAASYLDDSFSWMYSNLPTPEKSLKDVLIDAPNQGEIKVIITNK